MIRKSTSAYQYLIAGLGNPGKKYEKTRHNTGFRAVEKIAENENARWKTASKFSAKTADVNIGGEKCLLVEPQTFMNLSGTSVGALCDYYKIPPEKVIVIFDDISLDTSHVRIRRSGSAGGHNGIKDIISYIGEDFPRIKIGVGKKPRPEYDLKDWVLGTLYGEDGKNVQSVIDIVPDIAVEIIKNGADSAMNKFNR